MTNPAPNAELVSIFREMSAHVASEQEKEGRYPTPKLKAPQSTDDVVIVGAGPSGLHMAYELLKKGIKKITILEETDRVGGKSHTEKSFDGKVKHDMGTCYTNGDYVALFKMIEELKIDIHTVPVPGSTVRFSKSDDHMTFSRYIAGYLHSLYPNKNMGELEVEYLSVMLRYIMKHKELFGNYDGELMPEPSKVMLKEVLNITFDQFLIKHDMVALRPAFTAAQTIMGYGQLDEISAIYGFMWMTPRFVHELASASMNIPTKMFMYVEGFEYIWSTVAKHLERQGVKIILNARVRRILYYPFRRKAYDMTYRQKYRMIFKRFDWLIWSPSLEIARNIIRGFKRKFPEYYDASLKMTPQFLTTTLVKVHNESWSMVDYWMDNVNGDRSKNSVWADRYTALVKNVSVTEENSDHDPIIVSYIFGPNRPCVREVKNVYLKLYQKYHPRLENDPHIWSYFPHFSVQEMADGILWKIFGAQGASKAWFIGSSVSFESVKSVMDYNHLILRNIEQ